MGIVRPSGRDAVRLLTEACDREGRQAWTEARGVDEWAVVVPAPAMACGADADARQIAPDLTRVWSDSTQKAERGEPS